MPLSLDGLDGSTALKTAKTPRRIKRERARMLGGSHCHISPTMSHSSARGNPTLIKTGINNVCCKGGAREQIKNSFWGCSRGELV